MTPTRPPAVDVCPQSRDIAPPQRDTGQPGGLDSFITDLAAYLSQGGSPALAPLLDLESMLRGDLTDDGNSEFVYFLTDPQADQVLPTGVMVVFTCQAGEVGLLYRYQAGPGYGLEGIAVADMTGDSVAEVVFSEFTCGAHTCVHTPYVWTWEGYDFVDLMGADFQFPYPIFELTSSGLVVTSLGVGSVGAGPQRSSTTTLIWTGDLITATETVFAIPTYRYHAFLDGDQALSAADYVSAQAAYEAVALDDELDAWGAYSSAEEERAWFQMLGRWRLVVLYALQDRVDEAQNAYNALAAALSLDAPASPVMALAERFWRSYQRDGDVVSACSYAVGTDEAQAVLNFLNGFGYSNPVYELPDLCPSRAYPRD